MDSDSFLFLHSSQVCNKFVCPLAVVLSQIFFNLTTLLDYRQSLSSFPLPSSRLISQILPFFFLSSLIFFRTEQNYLRRFMVSSFDGLCQGSQWLFQFLLC